MRFDETEHGHVIGLFIHSENAIDSTVKLFECFIYTACKTRSLNERDAEILPAIYPVNQGAVENQLMNRSWAFNLMSQSRQYCSQICNNLCKLLSDGARMTVSSAYIKAAVNFSTKWQPAPLASNSLIKSSTYNP